MHRHLKLYLHYTGIYPICYSWSLLRREATIIHIGCEARNPWVPSHSPLKVTNFCLFNSPCNDLIISWEFLAEAFFVFLTIIAAGFQLLPHTLQHPTLLFYLHSRISQNWEVRFLKSNYRICNLTPRNIIPKSQTSFPQVTKCGSFRHWCISDA